MMQQWRLAFAACLPLAWVFPIRPPLSAQTPEITTIIQGVDASVKNRIDRIAAYTVTEHYQLFRGKDETHPVVEMLVKTDYRKASGKSYTILSQSGSSFWRNEVLGTLLDNEKRMSQPGNVETALINSNNYEMKLDADSRENLNGRDCLVLEITPRRSSEYLFNGKLLVDAHDYSIVQLKGTASKAPSSSPKPPPSRGNTRDQRTTDGHPRRSRLRQRLARENHRGNRLRELPA